jgi:hypothetical protein
MTQNTYPQTILDPPDKYYIEAAEYLIRYDRTWCSDFCEDCPRLHVYPAGFYDPGDTDCDADLNPLNECCIRRELLFEDRDVYREACERYGEETDGDFREDEGSDAA